MKDITKKEENSGMSGPYYRMIEHEVSQAYLNESHPDWFKSL